EARRSLTDVVAAAHRPAGHAGARAVAVGRVDLVVAGARLPGPARRPRGPLAARARAVAGAVGPARRRRLRGALVVGVRPRVHGGARAVRAVALLRGRARDARPGAPGVAAHAVGAEAARALVRARARR